MKVVLFCGGQGMRMREYSDSIPKPMVPIGSRPILWHLMKYYAHHGHKEFILCLGYRGDVIKNYFLNYDECLSNDFVLTNGAKNVELLSKDIDDWKVTFVDTGLHSNIGQRLMKVRKFVQGEDTFLANYADGLSDFPLATLVDHFMPRDDIGGFLAVRPMATHHLVSLDGQGIVTDIHSTAQSSRRINGGFFIFRSRLFDYMREGEELVEEPFRRLIDERKLMAYPYDGFWACMDTFKEKQHLDDVYSGGNAPWEVWRKTSA
jgi:glucose-1-phosphate cytidylyltransferase